MLVSLTVGKVDAGVAVLLTQDNRLVRAPGSSVPDPIQNGIASLEFQAIPNVFGAISNVSVRC